MARVFISYSRKDIEFAKRLTAELKKSELDFWIDWEGIPPTVDWWKEIEKGIEESDAFLFLISPDSSASKVCEQEIEVAIKNGKRLIPIVVRDIRGSEAPEGLGHLNWIFFREQDDFNASVKKLLIAIHSDYEWVAVHRRLQVKALEWERKNKENSFLLRGKDLADAELQLATNSSKEPYPTDLHFDYVSASRSAEDKQHRLSRRRRVIISIVGVVLLATIGLAMTGIFNRFIYPPVDMDNYWVTIPAGEFQMGSEVGLLEERPVHTVFVDEFQIGKYEVTNRQYAQCMKAGTCSAVPDAGEEKEWHPVVNVTWYNAKKYCEWIGGRLPTEAEWEKAASWDDQAKTKGTYPWGETIDCSYANYFGKDNGNGFCGGDTTPVGSYNSGKSPYGLYDMAGNVSEWVSSLFVPYPYDANDGREDMSSADPRVLRGGAWNNFNDVVVRSAYRSQYTSTNFDDYIGFRCAHDAFP